MSEPFQSDSVTGLRIANCSSYGDLDDAEILGELKQAPLLLRGGPADVQQFNAFTSRLCSTSVFNESPDREILDDESNIQSVNLGTDPFPLHPELSREPWKPDICFFHCINAPTIGGETTFCDGVELVRIMPAEIRAALENRSLIYLQQAGPRLLRFWLGTSQPTDAQLRHPRAGCPYGFRRNGDMTIRYFVRPALHRTMWSDELAFGNFLLFARYYLGRDVNPVFDDGTKVPDWIVSGVKEAAEKITHAVAWQPGDILILDNSRYMHGRNEIGDPENRLIASYFGYLKGIERRKDEIANPPWRIANFRPPSPLGRRIVN